MLGYDVREAVDQVLYHDISWKVLACKDFRLPSKT